MVRSAYVLAALLIPGGVVAQTTGIEIRPAPQGGGAAALPLPNGLPQRDSRPVTGTSVIRGRVIDASNHTPLRKAIVTIFGAEIRESRSAATDPEGRYEFTDLPAGQYNVSANKAGYVNVSYGQLAPNEIGKQLHLADKQTADKIDLALPRGAVITGRVLDEYGEPVPDALVSALRTQYTPSGPRPSNAGRPASTNDIGEFRLFGLPPGQYLLSASYRQMMPVTLTTGDNSGYALTYYPGTANQSDAIKLPVGMGGTISDVTLILVATRTARISGVAFDAQGRPLRQGSVMIMSRTPTMTMTNGGGPIKADGSFTIGGVAPGEYIVRAMSQSQPGTMAEAAAANVSVNGVDITDLRLEPVRPITVSGHVVLDPVAARSFKPETMRLSAPPSEPGPTFGPLPPPGAVRDDLTFEFKANQGLSIVRLSSPQGWMIKSVTLNSADVTDGLTFGTEDVSGLEVELTNKVPDLSGQVTNGNGDAVLDYFAVAFPEDDQQWTAPGIGRTAMTRPDDQGRFRFRSLRPGKYYIVAVDHVQATEWMDPAWMESVRSRATRVTLNEGDTLVADLKLIQQR